MGQGEKILVHSAGFGKTPFLFSNSFVHLALHRIRSDADESQLVRDSGDDDGPRSECTNFNCSALGYKDY